MIAGLLKHFLTNARREHLSARVYTALVDQLFGSGAVVGYMSLVIAAVVMAAVAYHDHPTPLTLFTLSAMLMIAVGRVVLLIKYKRWSRVGATRPRVVAGWEAAYAALGVSMAFVIGLVAANNCLQYGDEQTLLVSIIVTMGVAGGVTTRNGSRPKIVFAQIGAIMVPFCFALAVTGTRQDIVIAALFAIYFASTYLSTKAFYASLKKAMTNEHRNALLKMNAARTALRFDTALNSMSSGLLMFNEAGRLVVANDRIKAMWGTELIESQIGEHASAVGEMVFTRLRTPSEESIAIRERVRSVFSTGVETVASLTDVLHGRIYDLALSSAEGGGVVAIVDDITEKRRKDQEIYRLAHHDALTGMANRFDLSQQMARMMARASTSAPIAAMYIDLDGFKAVNDYFGHPVGDELLVQVARRINDNTRRSDLVARIGGDEFVVCFPDAQDPRAISAMAQRLIEEISRPYVVEGKTIEIGASAGLASAHAESTGPEEILRLADVALYEAKTNGRGQAIWFAAEMDDRARKHREMTLELRAAIEANQLTLAYQPVVDFRTGRIVCCEALARWTSPQRGIVPPSVFIPLAEATDLIHRLGEWSLRRACEDAAAWPDPTIKVAVNLSAAQFKHPQVAKRVTEIVEQSPLAPSRLEIEITETTLAENLEAMKAEMDALQQVGISIALDDFGMGYSSLSYLHNLPIQKVKLDSSFVQQLEKDPSAIALVASIVQMTHIMRKDLVIEGVETAEQLALISGAQARLIQGYYFSKPLAQDDVIAFIERNAAERRFTSRAEARMQRAERRARLPERQTSRRV